MKLKDLERDLQIMESTLEKMENINKNVEHLDDQVKVVKEDLIREFKKEQELTNK